MTEQVSGAEPWGGTPPGSDAAVEQGCTCPVIDNQHGAGGWEFAGRGSGGSRSGARCTGSG